MNKRFVFVHPHLKFGGAESQTVGILNELADRGHTCTLILHSATGGLLGKLDPRVQIVDLGFQNHGAVLIGALRARSVLRQFPPSVVVARLWSSILMIGSIAPFVRQHAIYFYEDLDPANHVRFIKFGHLKRTIIGWVYRRNSLNTIANTEHVANTMLSVYRLSSRPVVIQCGVDRFEIIKASGLNPDRERKIPKQGELRVATVGSLTDLKGLREIRLALIHLNRPVVWTLVGSGPLKTWLEDVDGMSGQVRIELAGATINPYSLIARSDVLVHGAKSESFGMVLLESLALGTPVAAHAANGPSELKAQLPTLPFALFNVIAPNSLQRALDELATILESGSNSAEVDLGKYQLSLVVDRWEALAHEF